MIAKCKLYLIGLKIFKVNLLEELPSCSLLLHLETLEWAEEDKRCCEIGILLTLSEQDNVSFYNSAKYGHVIAPLNR